MASARLSFDQSYSGGRLRRTAILEYPGHQKQEIWTEWESASDAAPAAWDGLLFGLIHGLMERGGLVQVDGPISQSAVRRLADQQELWLNLLPKVYQPVQFEFPSLVPDPPPASAPYLCAFSGGLDSLFTVIRHTDGKRGLSAYPIGELLLIHGFDAPLSMQSSFDALARDCRRFATKIGLPLRTLRTNLREAWATDWEQCHGAMLASCLHQFSGQYVGSLLASSASYDSLIMPWGSSPAIDYLYGTPSFEIVHDGAGFQRIDKVCYLHDHPLALECMKVCCDGPLPEKNCGVCRKCMRTRLALALWGVYEAPTFPGKLTAELVRKYPPPTKREIYHLTEIVKRGRKLGVQAEWLEVLDRKLRSIAREEQFKAPVRNFFGGGGNPFWRQLQVIRHAWRSRRSQLP